MDKILIVLIVLLVLAIIGLIIITRPKKKKQTIENIEIEPKVEQKEETIQKKEEQPISLVEKKEPQIESNLEEELGKTREQTEVIEIIESMQEKVKDITEKVADYEDEQEENAIISYTELLNAVKAKKEVQEELKFEPVKEEKKENEIKEKLKFNETKEEKKFRSTEAISPLGRINKQINSDSYQSNLKVSNMQDDDFLKSLKDFRSNL